VEHSPRPGSGAMVVSPGRALMPRARKPRPRRKRLPDWLRDVLGPAAQLLAVSLAAAILNGVDVAPVAGECLGGGSRPVAVVVRDDGGRTPESEAGAPRFAEGKDGPTRAGMVGRDGIEPPTSRFSVAGRGVQQGAGSAMVLVRWHVTEQAWAGFGRILVDRDVDRRGLTSGQGLGASGAESGGSPLLARPDTAWPRCGRA
jgi:hypothetical protein